MELKTYFFQLFVQSRNNIFFLSEYSETILFASSSDKVVVVKTIIDFFY
jgi:hypothetical protein